MYVNKKVQKIPLQIKMHSLVRRPQKMPNMCRLCLNQPETASQILITSNLAAQIEFHLGIPIVLSDTTPKQICSNCNLELNNLIAFKESCQLADDQLRELLDLPSRRATSKSEPQVPNFVRLESKVSSILKAVEGLRSFLGAPRSAEQIDETVESPPDAPSPTAMTSDAPELVSPKMEYDVLELEPEEEDVLVEEYEIHDEAMIQDDFKVDSGETNFTLPIGSLEDLWNFERALSDADLKLRIIEEVNKTDFDSPSRAIGILQRHFVNDELLIDMTWTGKASPSQKLDMQRPALDASKGFKNFENLHEIMFSVVLRQFPHVTTTELAQMSMTHIRSLRRRKKVAAKEEVSRAVVEERRQRAKVLRRKQCYRQQWEMDSRFAAWIAPDEKLRTKARCRACGNLRLNAEISSLKRHYACIKHQENMKEWELG